MRFQKIVSYLEFITNENLFFEDKKQEKKFEIGNTVIYLRKGKTIEDWNGLSDDEKSSPDKKPASEVIGIKPIEKIEGNNYFFLDKDGNPTIKKTKDEIVGDVETDETK
jgi:hypothetical protein